MRRISLIFIPFFLEEFVMLQTLNHSKYHSNIRVVNPHLNWESCETRSTKTINDNHLFHLNIKDLSIYLTKTRPTITWSSPIYKNIDNLHIHIPIIYYPSLWNKLLNNGKKNLFKENNSLIYFFFLVIFRQTTDDDEVQQYVTYLSYFVDLSHVILLDFAPTVSIYQWKTIQFIIQ
jgi:hypothetical protein